MRVAGLLKCLICSLLIISLNWTSLSVIGSTMAAFSDTEISELSVLDTGSLNLALNYTQVGFAPEEIQAGQSASLSAVLSDLSDVPIRYRTGVKKISGGLNVCENLNLEAKLDGQPIYNNRLLDFNAGPLVFATSSEETATSTAEWLFEIDYPAASESLLGSDRTCKFIISFDGWQLDLPDPSQGFTSHKEVSLIVMIGSRKPSVSVIYPNGGQLWYVIDPLCPTMDFCRQWCATRNPDPMNLDCQYEVKWVAHNPYGADSDLLINLYYSNNSGKTWLPAFATGTENDGSFFWRPPYDTAYVSHTARIKVVAYGKNNPAFWGEGISASDFCPPMLSIEDLMNQIEAETETSNSGGAPRAESNAMVPPSDIIPMTVEEINSAFDEIRAATSTPDTAKDRIAGNSRPTLEIIPCASPSDPGQSADSGTITGPPAIIPAPSGNENATSTDEHPKDE